MTESSHRSIPHQLFSLALPIIGLNVLSVVTLAVDTAMCGRLPDADLALTALGFATQVVFLLMVAMIGMTVGTVALVSRAYGAEDTQRVNHLLLQATQLTVIVGVAVGAIGNIFAGDVLRLLGASSATVDAGLGYLRPLLIATPFYYLNILYAAVLRGVGNTRLPFFVALGTNAVNVLLNYGFILGNFGLPALGVRGAALGTVASYVLGVLALVVLIRRGAVPKLFLPLQVRRIDRKLARELVRVGTPAALDMVMLNAAFLSIVGMLGRLDEIAVAAHGIGLRIQALAFVPGLSVSQATGAMVGQALGARNASRARKIVYASIVLCTAIMSALAVAIIYFVDPIVAIFDVPPGTTLAWYSVLWIELLGWGMPIVGAWVAFVGMLHGSGATRTSLAINMLATLVFQIPLSFLLGFTFGLGAYGVWIAFPISFGLKTALGIVVFKRGRWAKVGLRT